MAVIHAVARILSESAVGWFLHQRWAGVEVRGPAVLAVGATVLLAALTQAHVMRRDRRNGSR